MGNVIIWDIETVPDLKGFAAANGHDRSSDDEIRAAMGDADSGDCGQVFRLIADSDSD
jgi:hypothetical protein